MNVANALYPAPQRIAALSADSSPEPVVMLNLLRFRAKAEYPDRRHTELTGREAYMLYGEPMQRVLAREGGRLLFSGEVQSMVIGSVEEIWDLAALVEYPSAAAFATIVSSPEVVAIGIHRAAGLEGQLLIRLRPR